MRLSRIAAACLGAAFAIAGPSAGAFTLTFDNAGDSFYVDYIATIDGASLNARVTFTLDSIAAKQAVFSVSAYNSSTGPGTNRLTAFGIDVVSPTLKSASAANSAPTINEWDAKVNTNFPGGFQQVDLCAYAGPNCSGGSSLGVLMGATDTFTLTLTTDLDFVTAGGVKFTSPYASKWQAVGNSGNSWEFGGCAQGDPDCQPCQEGDPDCSQQVPEPGSLALLGLGLLGLGISRKRLVR